MKNDNEVILLRMRGMKAQPSTTDSESDPNAPANGAIDYVAENARLQSQLAFLQAEAARVVGSAVAAMDAFMLASNAVEDQVLSVSNLLEWRRQVATLTVRQFRQIGIAQQAARDFLSSLPRPTVVAVPIEPGEGDIEAMVDQMERLPYSAVLQDAARAAYRALVKRHGG